jgi:hypothetical protein
VEDDTGYTLNSESRQHVQHSERDLPPKQNVVKNEIGQLLRRGHFVTTQEGILKMGTAFVDSKHQLSECRDLAAPMTLSVPPAKYFEDSLGVQGIRFPFVPPQPIR